MNYKSCLRRCIKLARGSRQDKYVAIYQGYPEPSEFAWAECLKEIPRSCPEITYALHAMGRYEIRLYARGFETVSLNKAKSHMVTVLSLGIPPGLLMVAAIESRGNP
jgi:hypothetical protein